jgi:ubiquinone biosynthesis protein
VQERYSPQSVLRRLQRQAPSWLEQLPLLPDAMLDNLQQSRDAELRVNQQQQQVEELRERGAAQTRRQRRHIVAAIACLGVAVTILPGAWQQLADAPLVSWLLAGLALVLLWPRDS